MTKREWNAVLGGPPTRSLDEVWRAIKGERLEPFNQAMANLMADDEVEEAQEEAEELYEEEQKVPPAPAPARATPMNMDGDFGPPSSKAAAKGPVLQTMEDDDYEYGEEELNPSPGP